MEIFRVIFPRVCRLVGAAGPKHGRPSRRFSFILALVPALVFVLAGPAAARAPASFVPSELLEEDWYALSWNGQHAGYIHSVAEQGRDSGKREWIRSRTRVEMALSRMEMEIRVTMGGELWEVPGKGLRTFSFVMQMGPLGEMRYAGERKGDVLRITGTSAGKSYEREIPWQEGTLSPFEEMRRFRERFREGRKTFSHMVFNPEQQRAMVTTYTLEEEEEVSLLGARKRLLRVRVEQDILPGVVSYAWVDKEGRIHKMLLPMGGLATVEAVRTTKERAMSPTGPAEVLAQTLLVPDVPVKNPLNATRIVYRIGFRDPEKIPSFPPDGRQTVRVRKGSVLTLEVKRPEAPPRARGEESAPPEEKYLSPNPHLQSDDEALRKVAAEVTRDQRRPWEKASALTHWVYRRIEKKDLGVGFASAKDVFENPRGDCTEHAVLLAAMLRAVDIPSRVAAGLVYSPVLGAFGYHMWTEAFVENKWHALDAMFDETLLDPTHLKFTDSALDEGIDPAFMSEFIAFLQNMEIRIVTVNHE
ncbi:MAG: transglutaminase domain-containing protein [Acidobacteriota bacterium]|nr:MAG: transglutaminase domain-containing protein [Acidobacteriota bacterium]